jgi:hypothetical protein
MSLWLHERSHLSFSKTEIYLYKLCFKNKRSYAVTLTNPRLALRLIHY